MPKSYMQRNRERIARLRPEMLATFPQNKPRQQRTRTRASRPVDRATGICYYEYGIGLVDLCDICADGRTPLGGAERRCEQCGKAAVVAAVAPKERHMCIFCNEILPGGVLQFISHEAGCAHAPCLASRLIQVASLAITGLTTDGLYPKQQALGDIARCVGVSRETLHGLDVDASFEIREVD